MLKWLKVIVLSTVSIVLPCICHAVEYTTPEFKGTKSDGRVANVYICAIIGKRQGYHPNIEFLLSKVESASGISQSKALALRGDSEKWWEEERQRYDLEAFWKGMCEKPFEKISTFQVSGSVNPNAVDATLQQINTASCAITAMPKEVVEKLIVSIQAYMKSKDSIALIKAFETDEVPTYIFRCAEVQSPILLRKDIKKRESMHFVDLTERAMRLELIVELARRKNKSTNEIKRMKDEMYETLLQLNREYYGT